MTFTSATCGSPMIQLMPNFAALLTLAMSSESPFSGSFKLR